MALLPTLPEPLVRLLAVLLLTPLLISSRTVVASQDSRPDRPNPVIADSGFFIGPTLPRPVTDWPKPSSPPVIVDFALTRIEVTQATQCLNYPGSGNTSFCEDAGTIIENAIPMVVGKPGIIRVYARNKLISTPPAYRYPRVTLRTKVTRGGSTIVDVSSMGTALATDLPDRSNPEATVNFEFLCDSCAAGDTLTVSAKAEAVSAMEDETADNSIGPLELQWAERMPLTVFQSGVHLPGKPFTEDDENRVVRQHTFLRDVYPIPDVSYRHQYPITLGLPADDAHDCRKIFLDSDKCGDAVREIIDTGWLLRLFLCAGGGLCDMPDQIVAWLPYDTWHNGQAAPPSGLAVATVIDSLYTFGNLGSVTLAHEIGHNLGRGHPGTCGGIPHDKSWPYGTSGVYYYKTQEAGFRTFAVSGLSVWSAMSPELFDFMIGHHCRPFDPYSAAQLTAGARPGGPATTDSLTNGNWVSPYTYHQLFCAQSPDEAESIWSRHGNASLKITECRKGVLSTSQPIGGAVYVVSGDISSDGLGSLGEVYRADARQTAPVTEPGSVCLAFEDRGHALPLELGRECFAVEFQCGGTMPCVGQSTSASFVHAVRAVEGATHLILERDGQPVDAIELSDQAPIVSNLRRSGASVAWQASDADGDRLAFAVFYSPDGDLAEGARRMVPLAINALSNTLTVLFDELPGSNQAFVRVMATDNRGQTTSADSPVFSVPNKPPVVSILAPEPGQDVTVGTAVLLDGAVDDLEDPSFPETAYRWSSSLDGPLGTGSTLGLTTLSGGMHTITLSVTDSAGAPSSAVTTVFVRAAQRVFLPVARRD